MENIKLFGKNSRNWVNHHLCFEQSRKCIICIVFYHKFEYILLNTIGVIEMYFSLNPQEFLIIKICIVIHKSKRTLINFRYRIIVLHVQYIVCILKTEHNIIGHMYIFFKIKIVLSANDHGCTLQAISCCFFHNHNNIFFKLYY